METAVLHRATRILTPASLRIGERTDVPRRIAYLVDLRQRRGELFIELDPVPGAACATGPATLDFRLEDEEFVVDGVVSASSPGRATLLMRRGPTPRPCRPETRVVPPLDSVVAIFVADGTGLGRCCQPVLDIGLRALRLQSSIPFEPGTALRRILVVRQNRVVRDAEGTIINCSPVLQVDGRTTFECGVRLRPSTKVPPQNDPADLCEITDPGRVRAILWALCDLGYSVTLRSGEKVFKGRLHPVKGPRDALPQLRCTLDEEPSVAGAVQLECTLYGSGYRCFARIKRVDGKTVMLTPAPVVREWHRREEERLPVPSDVPATVSFRHPLDGRAHEHSLLDVSVQGVGFTRQSADNALWPGLPLDHVRLTVSGVTVRPPDATVRSMSDGRCGLQIGRMSDRETDRLRVELTKIAARPIEFSDGENLDEILKFHDAVRLLEPDMTRNLLAALDETQRTWRTAHRHPDGLMRTAFIRWKGGVGATLTLVRAYDASWVLQHSAVASPAVPANPGMLHSLLVRLAIPRPDGEYVCGYIDEDARSQHAVMAAFFGEWSTPEYRGATRFVLYSAATRNARGTSRGLRRLRGSEEQRLVENAATRVMDPVCARALGIRRGEIDLQATRKAYERLGLERGREAWGTFRGGRCTAILLREWASPGLCLSSILSAGMLLPTVRDELDEHVQSLCDLFLTAPLPGNPPVRFLLLPEGACHENVILGAGFKRVAGCTLYAMHRYGLQEYHRYVATRYGFLHGRLRARTPEAA